MVASYFDSGNVSAASGNKMLFAEIAELKNIVTSRRYRVNIRNKLWRSARMKVAKSIGGNVCHTDVPNYFSV